MSTLSQIVNDPRWNKLSQEKQRSWMKENNLTAQDIFVAQESEKPEDYKYNSQVYKASDEQYVAAEEEAKRESGWGEVIGRSLYRGAARIPALVGNLIEGDTHRVTGTDVGLWSNKDTEWIVGEDGQMVAIDTRPTEVIRNEQENSIKATIGKGLQKPVDLVAPAKTNMLTAKGTVAGILENAPQNGIHLGLNMLGPAGSALSNTVMYQDSFLSRKKELLKAIDEGKLQNIPENQIDELAAKYAMAEVIPEAGTNLAEAAIIKFFTRGLKLGNISTPSQFMKSMSQSVPTRVAKAAISSAPLEGIGEMATEYYQADQDIMLGLDKQGNKGIRIAHAGLVGAFSGAGTTGVIGTHQGLKEVKTNDILFNPITIDKEQDPKGYYDAYVDRYKAATSFVHLANEKIEGDNKQEQIQNLTYNVFNALNNNESIPMNETVFSNNLDFTNTNQPEKGDDFDILGSKRQAIRDPKAALDPNDLKSNAEVSQEVAAKKEVEQNIQTNKEAEQLRQARLEQEGQVDPKARQEQLNREALNQLSDSHKLNVGPGSSVTLKKTKDNNVKYTITTPKGSTTSIISPVQALEIYNQASQDADVHQQLLEKQQQNKEALKASKLKGTTAPQTTRTTSVSEPIRQDILPQYSQYLINEANNGTLTENSFDDYFTKQDPAVVAKEMDSLGIPLTGDQETDASRKIQYGEIALHLAGPHLQKIASEKTKGAQQQQQQTNAPQVQQQQQQVEPSNAPKTKQEQVVAENSSQVFDYIDFILQGQAVKLGEEQVRGDLVNRNNEGKVVLNDDITQEGLLTNFNNKSEEAKTAIIDKYIDITYQTIGAAITKGYLTLNNNGEIQLSSKNAAGELRNWIVSNSYLEDVANKIGKKEISAIKKKGSERVAFSIKEEMTDFLVEHMTTPDKDGNLPTYTFDKLVSLMVKQGNTTGVFKAAKKSKEESRVQAARYASIIRELASREVFKTEGPDKEFTVNTDKYTPEEALSYYKDNYASLEGSKQKSDSVIESYKATSTETKDQQESKTDTRAVMPEKVNEQVISLEKRVDELTSKKSLTKEENAEIDKINDELVRISSEYGDLYKLRQEKQLEAIKIKAIKLKGLRTSNPKTYITNRLHNIISYFLELNNIKNNLQKEGLLAEKNKVGKKDIKVSENRKLAFKDVNTFLTEATFIYSNPEHIDFYAKLAKHFNLDVQDLKWNPLDETTNKKITAKQLLAKTRDINKIAKYIQKVNIVAYDYLYKPSNAVSVAFENINKDLSFADIHLYDDISEAFDKEFRTPKRIKELVKEELKNNPELSKEEAKNRVEANLDKELLTILKETNIWTGGNSSNADWLVFKDFIDFVNSVKKLPVTSTEFLTEIQFAISPEIPTTSKKVRRSKNKFEFVVNDFRQDTNYTDVEDYIKKAKIPASVAKVLSANAKDIEVNYSVVPKDWTSKKEVKKSEELYKQRQIDRAEAQQIAEEEAAKIEDARLARIEAGKLAARHKQSDVRWSGIDVNKAEVQIPTEVDQYDQPSEEGNGTVYVTRLLDQNGDQIGEEKTTLKKLEAKKHLTAFENEIRQAEDRINKAEGTTKPKTVRKQIKKVADKYSYTKDENGIYTVTHPASEFTGVGETKAAAKKDLDLQTEQSKEAIAAIEKDVKKAAKKQKINKDIDITQDNADEINEAINPVLNDDEVTAKVVDVTEIINQEEHDIYNQIKDMNASELSQWLIDNSTSDDITYIATKVKTLIDGFISKGANVSVDIYTEDTRTSKTFGIYGGATVILGTAGAPTDISVYFNGPSTIKKQFGYNSGMNYKIILHEMIHAVTAAQILVSKIKSEPFNALLKQIIPEIRNRFEDGSINKDDKILFANALENPRELIAYGLTDRYFQEVLSTIKVGEKTAWSKFVKLIRNILGLSNKYESALDRLMSVSDSLLSEDIDSIESLLKEAKYSIGKTNVKKVGGITRDQSKHPAWARFDVAETVYSDNKIALVIANNITKTKKVFVGVIKDENGHIRKTRTDIESYTGDIFTKEELNKLISVKSKILKQLKDSTVISNYKNTQVGNSIKSIPKYTSIGQIKGMLEKSTSVKKLFKDISITPMIGALSFQENLENKLSDYVKQGMDENIAYEKAIEEATQESKNGPTSRMWFENHRMNTTKSDATYYMATSIEDGKIVNHFENAVNTYNELTDKERSAYNALLDQGDIESKEYVTLQEAKDAVKNRFGITSSEITQNVYNAYLQFRKAANNKFAAQNMLFFNDILDSIVDNNVPADKIDAVKDILTKHIYKKNNSSKERINRIKDDLFNIGITKSQYEAVVESLYPMLRVARSVLRNYVEGGVPGRVKRYRKSKADNPYVVRIFETKDVPIKEGSSETKKVRSMRFATFFPTEATMNDFISRIKTDNDIRMLFNGEDINVDNFKVNGKVDIQGKKEINAIIDKSFQTSDSSRIATNAMLDDVIKQMKNVNEDNESLVKAYETIRKQIIGVTNLTQIRSANNAFRSRKRGNIRGYDQTNPLTVLREDASQIAGFLARKDYINRMTKYALTEEGDRRIEATKLLQDSFTKYRDSDNVIVRASAALSNAASVSFMTFRVITATAQAHQYFLFGVGEMTTAGATETEALRILASNYVKLSLVRLGISASDLRAHLSGDKMLAKAIRSSMPKGGYRFILEALDAISVKEKVGSKDQNKFYNRIFERDEIELLLRHRNNNDVSDNLTKEMNNFEWSEKEAFGVLSKGKDFIGGIANAGMILFNEMEVLNREASLLSMYQFRKSQGDSSFVADVKATSFMLRVNSDFNSINKIGFLRKHPELSALFALTGYAFHATGLLGYRTLQAFGIIKSKSNGAKNFRGLIAYIIMGGLLGGMKGEPFWDILNKFWSKVVGHNAMLEFEEAAKSGDHNKITQKIIDFAFRGAPALIGVDWSSNVALRPPMVDSIMDFATNKNTDLGQTGAGLSWASGLFKALGTAAKGEYSTTEGTARTAKRTIEDLNIGGISQWMRAERYKNEGYTTKSGTPIYIGDKPRKLSDRDAVVYKTGFKTLEMARTQEVVNDQISIGKEYWEKKRSDAINNYFKLISPYINKNQSIPKGIQEKADKEIIQFNNKLSLASKGTLLSVDPIVGDTISRSLQNRYKPNKRVMGYQGTYNSLLNGSHDSLSSDAEDDGED